MKDIGSIFPLYDYDLRYLEDKSSDWYNTKRINFSLCREAFTAIIDRMQSAGKKVLIPAYTCGTVVTPFKEHAWDCFFYPIGKSLRIEVEEAKELALSQPFDLMIVHPYYGKGLNEEEIALIKEIRATGCKIIVDITQCIFSKQRLDFVDFYIGSYRKWFAIPDGGFMECADISEYVNESLKENDKFVSLQKDSMYLRGLYFDTDNEEIKNISRRINKSAVELVESDVAPHKMSNVSLHLLEREDKEENQRQRFENYKYLFNNLQDLDSCKLVCNSIEEVTSAPLYFVVYVNDRSQLQADLAAQHIYAPVIWPVTYDEALINDTVKDIYNTILAIPIDQRYNQDDMDYIVKIIKQHYNV
jgi:hypothetical protein